MGLRISRNLPTFCAIDSEAPERPYNQFLIGMHGFVYLDPLKLNSGALLSFLVAIRELCCLVFSGFCGWVRYAYVLCYILGRRVRMNKTNSYKLF